MLWYSLDISQEFYETYKMTSNHPITRFEIVFLKFIILRDFNMNHINIVNYDTKAGQASQWVPESYILCQTNKISRTFSAYEIINTSIFHIKGKFFSQ